jgi:uncharacterized membrane protein YjgN (DUF898 family)
LTQTGWGTPPEPVPRRRRRPVAEIFEEVFRLYRQNFWLMVGAFAVFQIPFVIATVPFEIWNLQLSFDPDFPSSVGRGFPSTSQLGLFVVAGVLLAIAAIILGTFGSAAISYIVGRARTGDRPPAREVYLALRRLAGAIIRYCAILIVGGFLLVTGLIVAIGLIAVVLAALGAVGPAGAFLLTMCALIVIGVLLVVIGVRISLAVPALVLERQRPMDALRRSWDLVRGSTWRTFGIVVLTALVVGLIGGLVSPIFLPGVMQGVLTGSPAAYLLVAVVSGLVQIVLGPILPAVVTVLYFDYAQPTS